MINNPTSTSVFEKHNPSSFRLVFAEAGNPQPAFFPLQRGVDAMNKIIRLLEELARDFHKKNKKIPEQPRKLSGVKNKV